jgi:hypothetical protein
VSPVRYGLEFYIPEDDILYDIAVYEMLDVMCK